MAFEDGLERRIRSSCLDITPRESVRRVYAESNQRLGMLAPGAEFYGFQSSKVSNEEFRYEVSVEIKEVNVRDAHLAGFLKISNLTQEFPELTTFFEAEIVGTKNRFLTRRWDADEDVDRSHWSKFAGFTDHFERAFTDSDVTYDYMNERYVFMRWKELFLVPDHRIRSVNGASYEGFYYICADLQDGLIDGFYYHHNSAMFQRLELRHRTERRFQGFEFR